MSAQSRAVLKGYFNTGDQPSEANFADLVDSAPNLTDDGTTGTGELVRKTSPTIVTPTVASLANMTHNHQNAAGGGSLDAAAIGSGVLDNARVNFPAPGAIGGTTPGAGTFSALTCTGDVLRIQTAKTPASATAAGTTGQIAWDANYLYICVATDTWRRVAHASW